MTSETLDPPRPAITTANQRTTDRQRLTGRATVTSTGHAALQGRLLDANMEGISIVLDEATRPSTRCNLDISCFHHGRSLRTQIAAICVHSTLSGNGFKTGFRFEHLCESTRAELQSLLSQPAK